MPYARTHTHTHTHAHQIQSETPQLWQAGVAVGALGAAALLCLSAVPLQPAQAITAEQLLYLEVCGLTRHDGPRYFSLTLFWIGP